MSKKPPLPLRPEEKLLKIYRQTELKLLKPVLIVLAVIYIPWFFLIKYDLAVEHRGLLFFWTALVTLYGLRQYLLWYLREYVITSDRLVHISHYGLFKKRVAETPLERILNVSFATTGLISSIFGFGDVEVQVVGLTEPIVLKNIKHPEEIKDYLWQMHSRYSPESINLERKDIPHLEEKIGYSKSSKIL